MITLN